MIFLKYKFRLFSATFLCKKREKKTFSIIIFVIFVFHFMFLSSDMQIAECGPSTKPLLIFYIPFDNKNLPSILPRQIKLSCNDNC